jgi:hypothetical protein
MIHSRKSSRGFVERSHHGIDGTPIMPNFEELIASPTAAYDEGLAFFRGRGALNTALRRIVADSDRNGIEYAIIGAIALNQHGYRRFTEDIEVLMTQEGLKRFREQLVGPGYRPAFQGATKRFRTTTDNIPVEIVVAGEYPGDGLPKPVVFPDPRASSQEIDGVNTVMLEKLIELKLASGMSAPDRLKDLADVQEIIKVKGRGEDYAQALDESVRENFRELRRGAEGAHSLDGGQEP